MTVPTIELGAEPEVSRIALGCMGMAGVHGGLDENEGVGPETIRRAVAVHPISDRRSSR